MQLRALAAVSLAAVAGAVSTSCGDFSLSSAPRGPAIASFVREGCQAAASTCADPHAAFAGEDLLIFGANLDPIPESNIVLFGIAAARGAAFTPDGALRVTVPDDAVAGPLVLSTSQGQTEPSQESFVYRGLGHPRRGTIATTLGVLLHPVAIAVAGGRAYLASEWMEALLDGEGRRLRLGFSPKGLAATPSGTGLVVGSSDHGQLWMVDVASWPQTAARQFADTGLDETLSLVTLPAADPPRLCALGLKDQSVRMAIVDLVSGETIAQKDIGLAYMDEAHVTPDGRWLVATGGWGTEADIKHELTVIDLQSGGFPVKRVDLPEGEPIHRGPFALDATRAYVPMVNGRIYQLDLLAGPAWARREDGGYDTIDAFYGQVVVGLSRLAEGTPMLLAQLPGEGRLVAYDLSARRRLWSANTSEEALGQFAFDTAARRVYVADQRSNVVFVVDYTDGRPVDALSFALGLGSTSDAPAQGAAYDPAGHRVLIPARRGRVLVSLDPDSLKLAPPILLSDDPAVSAPRAVQVSPKGRIYVLHESHLGFVETVDGKEAESVPIPLAGLGQRLVFLGDEADTVLVGMNDRVALLRDGALGAELHFPGSFLELLLPAGDRVLIVWSQLIGGYDRPQAGVFDARGLRSAGSLELPALDAEFLGALTVGGEPWLFYAHDSGAGFAKSLAKWEQTDFQLGPDIASSMNLFGPVAATPDGRRFLWTDVLGDDGRIRFARFRPATSVGAAGVVGAAFVDVSVETLPGPLCGATFSPSGERAFIPACSQDEIVIVE